MLSEKDLDFMLFFNEKSIECALLEQSCDANEIVVGLLKISD